MRIESTRANRVLLRPRSLEPGILRHGRVLEAPECPSQDECQGMPTGTLGTSLFILGPKTAYAKGSVARPELGAGNPLDAFSVSVRQRANSDVGGQQIPIPRRL